MGAHDRDLRELYSHNEFPKPPKLFKNGVKAKYRRGLTFTFIGLDPFNKVYGYFIHPTALGMMPQPELKEKRVDRLLMKDMKLL